MPFDTSWFKEKLESNPVSLHLCRKKIGEDGTIALAGILATNTTLRELVLDGTGIGAKGANHIADAFKHNTCLTVLYLSGERIGEDGA